MKQEEKKEPRSKINMPKYVIERDISRVSNLSKEALLEVSKKLRVMY